MAEEHDVSDLVSRWEEERRRGREPTPSELCRDCPQLTPEVERQINVLKAMNRLMDSERVAGMATVPDRPEGAPRPLPRVPGYEILGELGHGGMGVVYRARQAHLGREVALKVLARPLMSNPRLLQRFRNEAALAAGLVDAHILPVFDLMEVEGVPILVMPLVEGSDLGKVVRARSQARKSRTVPPGYIDTGEKEYLDRVLPLLDQLVAAVAALHKSGVLHRDIKPSNALVDGKGNLWLSDFGLARRDGGAGLTETGAGMGTLGYASPEQVRGDENIDGRADLFSLGATIYETLTLVMPYDKAVAKESSWPPMAPSQRQPLLPWQFDAVIIKALEPNPARRYRSADELQADWQRARQGLRPKARPLGLLRRLGRVLEHQPLLLASGVGLALVLLAIFGSGFLKRPDPPPVVPVDNNNRNPIVKRDVRVVTDPPGASVVLAPIDPETGDLAHKSKWFRRESTGEIIRDVPAGEYCVAVQLQSSGDFHEVYRVVPRPGDPSNRDFRHRSWDEEADGTIKLPLITIIPKAKATDGMVKFEGGLFRMGGGVPSAEARLAAEAAPFFLDRTEVTVRAFKEVLKLKDMAGQLDENPVAGVSFDQAVDYAERVGKRLPDEVEYELAATKGGTWRFPWGDGPRPTKWEFGPAGSPDWDKTETDPPVFGLFSNVAEWTSSWPTPREGQGERASWQQQIKAEVRLLDCRVVRGGSWLVVSRNVPATLDGSIWRPGSNWDPRYRYFVHRDDKHPGLGFRCAHSVQPRF